MQVKSNVKAGGMSMQHNEARVLAQEVRTNLKAGATPGKGLRVQTGVKAGKVSQQDFHFTM